jgi:hypothetical protein
MHTCDSSIFEAEAEGARVLDQLRLYKECESTQGFKKTLPQKEQQK